MENSTPTREERGHIPTKYNEQIKNKMYVTGLKINTQIITRKKREIKLTGNLSLTDFADQIFSKSKGLVI